MAFSLARADRAIAKQRVNVKRRGYSTTYPPGVQQAIDAIEVMADECEPELVSAVNSRVTLLDRARKDMAFRNEAFDLCRKDPVYFINNWIWTYDPRRTPSSIPLNLFPKQELFLHWLIDRIKGKECGLVEKSRDMGVSVLCCAFALHQFLFIPGSKITFGSRKEKLVHTIGDPDSLFEKISLMIGQLPLWLLPKSYGESHLKFINGDKGSTITGEAGDNMGRGGRSRLYFLDEFAFVSRAQKVDAAVSNNTNVRIYVSTPNGDGNPFAKKRFSGKIPVFRLHWKDDPRKGQAWYEMMKDTLDPVVLAQELDIDYAAAKEGVVIPNAWILAAVELEIPAIGKRYAGLDVSDEGGDKNVFIMRKGSVIQLIEGWAYGNTTNTAYKAKDLAEFHRIKRLNYDDRGVGAGVRGTLESCMNLTFDLNGVNGGGATSDTFYKQYNHEASDIFKNLRAEGWWNLRMRFERTFEYVNRIKDHPIEDLISIPNHPELISQLGQPLYRYSDSGQIVIESKPAMKKRGIDSPDYADALVYAFAPMLTDQDFNWLANA